MSLLVVGVPDLRGDFRQPARSYEGGEAEPEEEEERESQRADVHAYSEGTFKGNGFGTEKNSEREVAGLQGL